MTTEQAPLGSGFERDTTAAEVLGGSDLTGKTVIVTGSASGISEETTRVFAKAGQGHRRRARTGACAHGTCRCSRSADRAIGSRRSGLGGLLHAPLLCAASSLVPAQGSGTCRLAHPPSL